MPEQVQSNVASAVLIATIEPHERPLRKAAYGLVQISGHGAGMDADTHDLIIQLSTRAGMIMEDAVPAAISLRTIAPNQLAEYLNRLTEAAEDSAQLLRSALLLVDHQ